MMFIYTVAEAIRGIVAGILIAIFSKKAENVVYTKLDKIGRITNIVLIVVYAYCSPVYLAIGVLSEADHGGFLGVLGWIIAFINASAALVCGLGLGFSVALRKQGKSKQSFIVQFAGAASILLSVALYAIFVGNLLSSLN